MLRDLDATNRQAVEYMLDCWWACGSMFEVFLAAEPIGILPGDETWRVLSGSRLKCGVPWPDLTSGQH